MVKPGLMFALAVFGSLLPAPANAENWELAGAVNFDTGRYGAGDRTNSIYVPFTVARLYSDAKFSVTVPYLRQSAWGQVVWIGGKPVRPVRGPVSVSTPPQDGLGDILLRGDLVLVREASDGFDLVASGQLELPTADEKKWLGTGEMSESAGLEFTKELLPGWSLLAAACYTLVGDPPGIDYNNQLFLGLGLKRLLSDKLTLTVQYETESSIVSGNPDPVSLNALMTYLMPDGFQATGGASLGLSDGSPEIGVSLGVSQKF
jgi:hypothetical protein